MGGGRRWSRAEAQPTHSLQAPRPSHWCLVLNFAADRKRFWAGFGTAAVETEQALSVCASTKGSRIFAGWMGLGFAEVKFQFPGRAS